MANGLWGKKIGMTQIFAQDGRVVPVTVVEVTDWIITQIKNQAVDGYDAIQVGHLRKRLSGKNFDSLWLKNKKQYFDRIQEVRLDGLVEGLIVGTSLSINPEQFVVGSRVDVAGVSKGCGFAGVMRRWNFAGSKGSHGHRMGRTGGALGGSRTQGKVVKGKKMAGHMGVDNVVTRNLEVIRLEADHNILLVKGSVPGRPGSYVFIKKSR